MGDPIRVLQLLVSTELGGGPAHVRDLIAGLPPEEFKITVAAPGGGPYADIFRRLGAEFVDVRCDRLSPPTLVRVIRLIRERKIQVVHSHGKGAGVYGRIAAWWTGVRAIHTFHGIHYKAYGFWARRPYLLAERGLARGTYMVIHVSESQAQEARGLGLAPTARSRVIMNATDSGAIRALAENQPLSRKEVGLRHDALVVGTVARLDPVKALDVLLDAFALVHREVPNAQLLIVGEGPEEAALRERARALEVGPDVVLAGAVPDAARCLPTLELYASASRQEGLPLAMLEAMASGLAVVATAVPGHVDVVEDGVTGILVPPENPRALADAMSMLLRDPPRRRAMGEAGRQRVETTFPLGPMVAQLADLYRAAAGSF